VAAVVAAALAITACGKEDNSAQRDYAKRADAVCAGGNRAVAPLEARLRRLTKQGDAKRYLSTAPGIIHQASAATRRSLVDLAAIRRPGADDAKLRGWIADVRRQVDLLDQTADAIGRGDGAGVQKLTSEIGDLNTKNNSFARSYGMRVCSESAAG
jgi:hypothetical protein